MLPSDSVVSEMKYNILVVDDEESVHEILTLFLVRKKKHTFTVYSALGGKAGIEMYSKLAKEGWKPDLVLMDLLMPGMDGIEATKRIIEDDPGANIYLFTADAKAKEEDALKAGAKGVIPKMTDWYEMAEDIIHILESSGPAF